jgi:hypothetical protein
MAQFPALSTINLLAVLVAALAHTVIGLVWFQSWFFGRKWVELAKASLNPAAKWLPAGLIGHVVMAFVLAMIIKLAHATTFWGGALVGIIVCVGFMATLEIGELIWEKIPFKLYLIRVGNQLLGLAVMGGILAIWQ